MICGVDLIQMKGCTTSNLGRSSIDGRWRMALVHPSGGATGDLAVPLQGRAAHRSTASRALRCTKHGGEKGKTERGSRGCSPRAANGSAGGGCDSHWRGGSSGLGWQRRFDAGGPPAPRRQREASQRRPRPLLGFNSGKWRWIGGARRWLGFGSCGSNSGKIGCYLYGFWYGLAEDSEFYNFYL
jgi:hypothetical protein